jgi:hypothetical protein
MKAVIVLAVAALFCKLLLALNTYGTNDVYAYQRFSFWSRYMGVSIYRAAWDFNHPPSIIYLLRLIGWLARVTPLPFQFWIRLPAIAADVGILWIVSKMPNPRLDDRVFRWTLALLAIAPPLIFISGFHGNTDSVVIFFLLLSVYLIEKKDLTWAAGVAFGLAMSLKVFPVILIPVLFFYLATYRKRIVFFGITAGLLLVGWSPFVFQDPGAIVGKVFGYRSIYGNWGLSYLLIQQSHQLVWLNWVFQGCGAYLLLVTIGFVSFWMNRGGPKPPLVAQTGIIFFLFLAACNGFGVQYLAWLVPWAAWLGPMPALMYFATSGVFLFLVYNYWAQGIPWYLADSNRIGDYVPLEYFQVVCWISVVVLLAVAWRQMTVRKKTVWPAWASLQTRRVAMTFLAVAFLGYPMASQMLDRDSMHFGASGREELHAILASQYSELVARLLQMGRNRDAMAAAAEGLEWERSTRAK